MSHLVAGHLVSIETIQKKYRFRRKLGKGGFCDVFLAEARDDGRMVAIKMMEMNPAAEKLNRRVARFRREMILYSQLDHPNIVKIYDSGETESGLLFIVFEYLHGNTLAQLLKKEGTLSLSRTMTLMGQVLSALGAAHARGIIHRDLKPENIMVVTGEEADRVKVLDFGISTFISGQYNEIPRITLTKEFLGTPSFAAPEQLRGEPVSTKVDIYAWGLIFLECITGTSPFTGSSVAAIVQQQLASSPVPLPAAVVNHRLGALLQWTLEKKTDRRAGNAAILASHLETVSLAGITEHNGYLTSEAAADNASAFPGIVVYETVSLLQERRLVTIVCCTLNVQVTRYSETPDVLDEIYQDLLAFGTDFFTKAGAYVMTDMADRMCACFGYPEVSDTDARQAAQCALELVSLFTQRNTAFSMQHGMQITYRIGIHTGMVTVKKNHDGRPQLMGLALNIAGKLCNSAISDPIIISKSSYTLLKEIVECREVAPEVIGEPFAYGPVYAMNRFA